TQPCLTGNDNRATSQTKVPGISEIVYEKPEHRRVNVLRKCEAIEILITLLNLDLVRSNYGRVIFDKVIEHSLQLIFIPSLNHDDLIVIEIRSERREVRLGIELYRLGENNHWQRGQDHKQEQTEWLQKVWK